VLLYHKLFKKASVFTQYVSLYAIKRYTPLMATKTIIQWSAYGVTAVVLGGLVWGTVHAQSQGREKSRSIASLHADLKTSESDLKKSKTETAKAADEAAQRAKESTALADKLKASENALGLLRQPKKGPALTLAATNVTTATSGISSAGFPDQTLDVFVDVSIANSGDDFDIITFDDVSKGIKLVADGKTYFMVIGSGDPQNNGKTLLAPQTVEAKQAAKGTLFFLVDKNTHSGKLSFRDQTIDVNW
jgi:hypothetical protein